MDDWESVAVALQGVCVAFGGVALVLAAADVAGVVDPFVLGGGLFALGFALGAAAARSRDDASAVALHAAAVTGWVLVLGGHAFTRPVATWPGIALLALAGIGLCVRAVRSWRGTTGGASTV
jgi:hypothetical protein